MVTRPDVSNVAETLKLLPGTMYVSEMLGLLKFFVVSLEIIQTQCHDCL